MTCEARRLLFDYYREKPRKPCLAKLPRFFFKMAEICATPTKPLRRRAFQLDGLITPTLKAAGSNPVGHTISTKRYRCVWRKVRRINRFRAFSGPDFFFQTIDANRCFSASAPIRTGRFPFSGRCIRPAPVFVGRSMIAPALFFTHGRSYMSISAEEKNRYWSKSQIADEQMPV